MSLREITIGWAVLLGIFTAVCYVGMAFVLWETEVSQWSESDRMIIVLLAAAWAGVTGIAALGKYDEK